MLRFAWLATFCLATLGLLTLVLFHEETTWIDNNGFLHEPLFGLVPLSLFFGFAAIVLAIIDAVIAIKTRKNH